MPNIQSAKKKMRQDVKREKRNTSYEKAMKDMNNKMSKSDKNTAEDVKKAYSLIDKAAKKNVIHKNKAARLKSKVSKLVKKA